MLIALIDKVHPVLRERLEKAGHTCVELIEGDLQDHAGTLQHIEGIIVRSRGVHAPDLDRCPGLRFVARVGSGLENIDRAYCRKRGIRVLNSPEGNRDGVGETCLMLLLAMMKSLIPANASVRAGLWPREALRGTDLKGKNVGIIGFGQMGSAFAEKLRGFGVGILAYDKYRSGFGRAGIEECALERVLRESDVISLHLPLTDETRHFADHDLFLRMGRPVWFLNTSRGGVVHTAALLDAIDHGRVIAAALDVLEFERPGLDGLDPTLEPHTQQRLLEHQRVVLTPHIAGVTHEGKVKMAEVLAAKILHFHPHGTT
ncbi:MAG: phosphoglycerate dehydrogenase [Flavobacteriales bacterium]|nr:phosphoglycerate dehydrogenase [Flavobacteriales bacterium]